jgi:hypothetical protein
MAASSEIPSRLATSKASMACGTVRGKPSKMYPPRAAASATTGMSKSKTI